MEAAGESGVVDAEQVLPGIDEVSAKGRPQSSQARARCKSWSFYEPQLADTRCEGCREVIRIAVEDRYFVIHAPPFPTFANHCPTTFEIRRLFRPVYALAVQEVMLLSSRATIQLFMAEVGGSEHVQAVGRSVQLPPQQVLLDLRLLRDYEQA